MKKSLRRNTRRTTISVSPTQQISARQRLADQRANVFFDERGRAVMVEGEESWCYREEQAHDRRADGGMQYETELQPEPIEEDENPRVDSTTASVGLEARGQTQRGTPPL
jgi:hypothetical protein